MTEVEVPASGSVYSLDRSRSLCGFSVRAASANGDGHVWITLRLVADEDVRETMLPGRRLVAGAPATGPVLLSQELPLYRHTSWAWTVVAAWAPVPSEDVTRLLGADDGAGDPAAVATLEELGLVLLRTRIALAQ